MVVLVRRNIVINGSLACLHNEAKTLSNMHASSSHEECIACEEQTMTQSPIEGQCKNWKWKLRKKVCFFSRSIEFVILVVVCRIGVWIWIRFFIIMLGYMQGRNRHRICMSLIIRMIGNDCNHKKWFFIFNYPRNIFMEPWNTLEIEYKTSILKFSFNFTLISL